MPPLQANPTTVVLARESRENILQGRRERDVDRKVYYLNPEATPLTLITSSARMSKRATDPKVEWFEKNMQPTWDQLNGGFTTGDTVLTVDHGEYFTPGDIINVPRTFEHMRVTAVNTATEAVTVIRSVGPVAATTLVDNDDLQIVGNAYAEGSSKGTPTSHQGVLQFNYCQIVRTPFGVTETQRLSSNYDGDSLATLAREKLQFHKVLLEQMHLFGERDIDTSNADNPRRYAGGLLSFYTSNIKDAGGTLTEPEMEAWVGDLTTNTGTGNGRIVFAGSNVVSVMNQIAAGRLMMTPRDKTFGINVTQWQTGHGTLNFVKHPLLVNGYGGNGYAGWAVAVDAGSTKRRFLRNTKLIEGIQTNGDDAQENEYLTEECLQPVNPENGGILKNANT
jgi:hypothetical protein